MKNIYLSIFLFEYLYHRAKTPIETFNKIIQIDVATLNTMVRECEIPPIILKKH